jgi:hypothetical protein
MKHVGGLVAPLASRSWSYPVAVAIGDLVAVRSRPGRLNTGGAARRDGRLAAVIIVAVEPSNGSKHENR